MIPNQSSSGDQSVKRFHCLSEDLNRNSKALGFRIHSPTWKLLYQKPNILQFSGLRHFVQTISMLNTPDNDEKNSVTSIFVSIYSSIISVSFGSIRIGGYHSGSA